MPLPKPNKGETHDKFIDRCMADDVMNEEFPKTPQRRAVCEQQWQDRKKKAEGSYPNVCSAVYGATWAILPDKLESILDFVNRKAADIVADKCEAAKPRKPSQYKSDKAMVAVLPLVGVISQRVNMLTDYSGGTSTEIFGQQFDEAMANDDISQIIIDVDSPGGSVYGVSELTKKILAARGPKPVTAVANSLMASAAYWIASAADRIVVTPGGEVGSIGVIAAHRDVSEAEKQAGKKHTLISAGRYKTEGNEVEPLTDEGHKAIQGRVDEYYDMMVADIARGRRVSEKKVRTGFGEGRVLGAQAAVESGLADRVNSMERVLRASVRPTAARQAAMRATIMKVRLEQTELCS